MRISDWSSDVCSSDLLVCNRSFRAMAVNNRIAEFHDEMKGWRRDIHAHPETAFEELRTADFVAEKLAEFGIAVHRGLATTGVVGVLIGRASCRERVCQYV